MGENVEKLENGENKDHSSNLNLGGTHWVKLGPCFGLSGTRWMAVNWATCQGYSEKQCGFLQISLTFWKSNPLKEEKTISSPH